MAVRATARTTVTLLVLVFCASALARRWPGDWTAWLLGNRRFLGVSMAGSHALHLLLLVPLYALWVGESPDLVTLLGGGLASGMLLAMALTSTDAAQRRLGGYWRKLHRTGIWIVWIAFAVTYFPLAPHDPVAGLMSLALVAALALRWLSRSDPAPPAPAEPRTQGATP